jgi:hypothetical protein
LRTDEVAMRGEQRMQRASARWGAAVLALLVSALASPAPAATNFPMPPAIRPQVDFWIGVFATYSRRQDIIHDTEHLDRIYTVLDFRDLEAQGVSPGQIDALMRTREDEEKNRIRAMLFRLQEDPDPSTLTAEELRLQGMFANDPSPTKFMDAASPDRLARPARAARALRARASRSRTATSRIWRRSSVGTACRSRSRGCRSSSRRSI